MAPFVIRHMGYLYPQKVHPFSNDLKLYIRRFTRAKHQDELTINVEVHLDHAHMGVGGDDS